MSEWFANTWYLWNRRKQVGHLVDLWEVGCRWELFPVISRESLPHLANSDFHRPEHLYAWKTLLNAEKDRGSVLAALRRGNGHRRAAADSGGSGGLGVSLAIGLAGLGALMLCAGAYAVSAAAYLRLRRRGRGEPLEGFVPPVSIVKPLAGLDEALEENLESLYRIDYSAQRFEVVFSFAAADDPAGRIARSVADRHPEIRSIFVFDPREPGGNAKVNRLSAALRFARHRLVLFQDGNVRVRPDFLKRAVSWFADPRVGLVSHLFRASGAASFGSRIESLYLNGCLLPGTALIAAVLGRPCVVGKSILVSRRALDSIEGIGALRDYLAEDFVLGREVQRAGYRVVLSTDVLETTEVRKSVRAVWARHRRWSMMRRRLATRLYAGEVLASPLPWFALALVAPSTPVRLAALGLLALRWGVEMAVWRWSGGAMAWRDAALLPLRDLGAAAVFWAGVFGRSVAWRGRPLVIGRDTRILRRAA